MFLCKNANHPHPILGLTLTPPPPQDQDLSIEYTLPDAASTQVTAFLSQLAYEKIFNRYREIFNNF